MYHIIITIIIIIIIIGEEGHWSMAIYLLMSEHILQLQITVKSWMFFCSFSFAIFMI